MKKIAFIISAVCIFAACKQKEHGAFVVNGKIENTPAKGIVLLQHLPFDGGQPVVLDSVTIKDNGSFEIRGIAKEEGLYILNFKTGEPRPMIFINDNNNIHIKADYNDLRHPKVEGSPATAELYKLFEENRLNDSSLQRAYIALDTLSEPDDSPVTMALIKKRDDIFKEKNQLFKNFINSSSSPAAVFYALIMARMTMPIEEITPLVAQASNKFKNNSGMEELKKMIATENAKNLNEQNKQQEAYPLLGQSAPDLVMKDVNGKDMSISSFKGKYVLVDFWASWCGPCRQENPHVVAAYNKFKDKNFTILGVSLDENKDAWLKAVKDDQLTWAHMSDLKKWNSPAIEAYKFDGIPFNVLIDPQGKIIASGLRGSALESKLAEVLK